MFLNNQLIECDFLKCYVDQTEIKGSFTSSNKLLNSCNLNLSKFNAPQQIDKQHNLAVQSPVQYGLVCNEKSFSSVKETKITSVSRISSPLGCSVSKSITLYISKTLTLLK